MTYLNKHFKLARRPEGMAKQDDFEMAEAPVPELKDGEFLIQTDYISLDPTNRIWMADIDQYMPPVQVGEVMRAGGVGTVIESKHSGFEKGDIVSGIIGWQTHAVSNGDFVQKVPPLGNVPKSALLGPLGMTGTTAYFGLLDIGKPKEGETIVVSAAAGAVGTVVCQIAKIKGMRVVGIAGTDEKCKMLEDELGVDGTINYKKDDVAGKLDELCPDGIDVYFENVGGEILDAVLPRMNLFSRIPLCGLISSYNAEKPVPGPYNFSQLLMKRVTLQGFIILDYQERMGEAVKELGQWMIEGKIKHKETVVEGFEKLPEALNMLFTGDNVGKLMVKV
ncbi:NADP-dependent oxidoreductase [Pseudobacteriovorax antillogorgiicola]|uniref:Enoyl reductase (ER) domain-containing protein n=1 Tax=Pseudobacteriovorax antillogorgiicola TaxID=1513793 RepID=A0A1Y6CK49_9BACT|nr:NADP-dependent oxidoreductase [Pseudobacteriovorax antillogorgiicola]TCS47601.1 hypothetical protein EDD56_12042 [Pseudobacteriovorax antillogorgiicola]SMF60136.1 hypothetical protein SAMN06296036_12098 [Pseudobacteriovorax antillogorgiicola]